MNSKDTPTCLQIFLKLRKLKNKLEILKYQEWVPRYKQIFFWNICFGFFSILAEQDHEQSGGKFDLGAPVFPAF